MKLAVLGEKQEVLKNLVVDEHTSTSKKPSDAEVGNAENN